MAAVGITLCVLLVAGVAGSVFRLLKQRTELRLGALAVVFAVGALAALGCTFAEQALWSWTGLGLEVVAHGVTGALLAMMLFAVPLEEASKLVILWPLYQGGRLRERADGVLAAISVAAGFAAAESVVYFIMQPATGIDVVRGLLGVLAHLFFAACWGFVLTDVSGGRWLRRVWFLATLFHGLYDHIVFGRGAGTMVFVGPLLLLMLGLAWLGLKDAQRQHDIGPASYGTGDGASLDLIRGVVRPREKPVMLRWIVIGAFVTTGVALTALGLAIYVGHQIGVDFAEANESDVRANAPLLLLGAALMAAFPVSGYLLARASGTDSVIEPALGAAAAIAVVVVLLSMAAPTAVVFSLAVAPVALALSCAGAWFGMGR